MDLSPLVDRITRQVMANQSGALLSRRVWVVYTEDSKRFGDTLSALSKSGSEVTVVLPRWAQGVLNAEAIQRLGAKVVTESELKALATDVANADLLVLPSVPRALANQLASKDAEAFAARVVKTALERNRRVVALEGVTEKLKALGVSSVGIAELAGSQAAKAPEGPAKVADLVAAGISRVGADPAMGAADAELARMIDHTLLKPEATEAEVTKLCQEAAKYHFASVCVNPYYVPLAAKLLKGTDVKVCTVVGFPLGATPAEVKAFETKKAIADGAQEIDMVLNIGALKSKRYDVVEADIRAVVQACNGTLSKVIIESCLLTDEEKVTACALSKAAGADFVKTSTGFSKGGATAYDVALMRATVGPKLGVKASGGVRDRKGALVMVRSGATRIGASASVAIVTGKSGGSGY